jgi:hypothetical protein
MVQLRTPGTAVHLHLQKNVYALDEMYVYSFRADVASGPSKEVAVKFSKVGCHLSILSKILKGS